MHQTLRIAAEFWPLATGNVNACSEPTSVSCHLGERSLRLGEPERHVHSMVQLHSSGQLGLRQLSLANPGIQRAETAVAVGQEGAHPQFLG